MATVDLPTDRLQMTVRAMEREVGKVIVGQHDVVRGTLICLLAHGHALLEGVPGLGKTMLVRTLGQVLDLDYSRIQFTPDLMPADILGTNIVTTAASGERGFQFVPGPIFANIVLADEINRATPKTQSALLEAMQEGRATVGNREYPLPQPFFVLATQNPLEMEGTYPLPEAQLDRFFFKLLVRYPTPQELGDILRRTTSGDVERAEKVVDGATLLDLQRVVREVPIASHVLDFVVRLTVATHPERPEAPEITRRFVRYGASPRGAQALVLAAKINAILEGRFNVAHEDVRRVAYPALRHRVMLNFDAQVEGVDADYVLSEILKHVPND